MHVYNCSRCFLIHFPCKSSKSYKQCFTVMIMGNSSIFYLKYYNWEKFCSGIEKSKVIKLPYRSKIQHFSSLQLAK